MLRWFLLGSLAVTVALVDTDARACGGCFHEVNPPPPERSVVTGHRMAFSISTTQTVLWDQIRYSGNPREFAWVLPVKPGAIIQASRDEWFAALDAATQPVINAPPQYYGSPQQSGCALVACGASGGDGNSGGSGGGSGPVQVLAQGVVGPYDTVTLQSTDPNALTNWLTSHSFDIPASIAPTIDAYVAGGFDFIAVRLRPNCGVNAMEPVRIVTPGADPTLPLRMVAAGTGAEVDLVLWVLGEGRWQTQNFPSAVIDDSQLVWDTSQALSNYSTLAESVMGQQNGRTWLTEFSAPITAYAYGAPSNSSNPTLYQAYYSFCGGYGPSNGSTVVQPVPCDRAGDIDAGTGTPPPEAGPLAAEAGDDAADMADAEDAADDGSAASDSSDAADLIEAGHDAEGSDAHDAALPEAAPPDAGFTTPPPPSSPCGGFDDIDVATLGLDPYSMWLTRIRAHLPAAALATDLVLTAAPQNQVSNVHQATQTTSPQSTATACETTTQRNETFGGLTFFAVTASALAALLRRRTGARR
jgi:hypothetical protein